MKRALLVLAATLLAATTAVAAPSAVKGQTLLAPAAEQSAATPGITLRFVGADGRPALGISVVIHSALEENRVVFEGTTDKSGTVQFHSTVPRSLWDQRQGAVLDMAYSVHAYAPDGQTAMQEFALTHIKPGASLSSKDRTTLEQSNEKERTVKLQKESFTGKATTETVSPNSIDCWSWRGYTECLEEVRNYTGTTRIGVVNVAAGLAATFTYGASAKVAIESGFKWDGGWQPGSTVNVTTTNGTTAEYVVDGTCLGYYGGPGVTGVPQPICRYGQYIQGNFNYRYERWTQYTQYGSRTTYNVYPTNFIGPGPVGATFVDSRNGKRVSHVMADYYGQWFTIRNGTSNTKTYTQERSISSAFSIPTPVGAFSAGLTTAYATSHGMKWSTTIPNWNFYIYDWDRGSRNWYVTD